MLFKLVCLFLSMQSTWFAVFVMKILLMWLLVANLFVEVLIHKRTTRFLLVRILYSLMLIIPLLFIVGIVVDVVDVVKLIRFNIFIMYCKNNLHSNNFFVYLFSLIKILQINARGDDQNVDENREDDSEEETLKRRTMTHIMISLLIFMFSSLVKDIIAFM